VIFEHFALNVLDAKALAGWYVNHCRMKIVRGSDTAPFAHFLADRSGRMVMEVYSNPAAPLTDLRDRDPLYFHVAFTVDDPAAARTHLEQQGAVYVSEVRLDDGSLLIMLRDPWGIPLQLCKRVKPLV
jgi:glyoxylase I family protein